MAQVIRSTQPAARRDGQTWEVPEYIISNLTHLVDIHPELLEHSYTYEVLGRAYGLQDNRPLAAEIFEMALKLDPHPPAGERTGTTRSASARTSSTTRPTCPATCCPTPCAWPTGAPSPTPPCGANERRPELLRIFEDQVYGKAPARPDAMTFEVNSVEQNAPSTAWARAKRSPSISRTAATSTRWTSSSTCPTTGRGLCPASSSPTSRATSRSTATPASPCRSSGCATASTAVSATTAPPRPAAAPRSRAGPSSASLRRGYAPLHHLLRRPRSRLRRRLPRTASHPLFYKEGQTRPAPDEWGAIGAWGLGGCAARSTTSRPTTTSTTNASPSWASPRLGKDRALGPAHRTNASPSSSPTTPAAAAPPSSAAASARPPAMPTTPIPTGFCENFKRYDDKEDELPVDQHMLIALVAPRPRLRRQRRRGPLGRPARRVSRRKARSTPVLPPAGHRRSVRRRAAAREPARPQQNRLPHPHRQTRRHTLRLGTLHGTSPTSTCV